MLRKCLFERDFALPPGQIRRYQRVDVGIDGEMLGSVNARSNRQAVIDTTITSHAWRVQRVTIATMVGF